MKTTAEQFFQDIVRNCFHAELKPLGFRKKANNFYRRFQDVGQIVNIQKSVFYSKVFISFTVNFGLFVPEYFLTHFVYHQGVIPDYPTEPVCAIRSRIERENGNGHQWFELSAETNVDELSSEIRDLVRHQLLPYFDRNKTRSDILPLLENPSLRYLETFTKLIIFGEYQEHDKAQREYEKLKSSNYIFANFISSLNEYRDKYHLQD